MHTQTNWHIVPSFAFDTLCLLNTLTGDEFYREFYPDVYQHFLPLLTPPAQTALANLKRKVKDESGGIISAMLCLYFSAVEISTLDDLLSVLDDPTTLKNNFSQTPYYDPQEWQLFESIGGDLRVVLNFLKAINLEQYWHENNLPNIQTQIARIEPLLPGYNVVEIVEKHLGFALASDIITVYLLSFTQPHGIKIVGTAFLTDAAWPFKIVVRNAVHEMMHPPYTLDDELKTALESLKSDEFLMDKILNHNPVWGYNSFEGYVEENCVRALDQYINEKFQIASDSVERWRTNDDGMHVLAAVLHDKMKQANFPQGDESFRSFLLNLLRSGGLEPIKQQYERIMAG